MKEKTELYEAQTAGENSAAAGQDSMEPQRMSWQQILMDPEYAACFKDSVSQIVRRRLKNRQGEIARLQRLRPLLEALSDCCGCGCEPEQLDIEAITALVKKGAEKSIEDIGRAFSHLDELMAQEAGLQAEFPGFELLSALEEPEFLRLTAPHTGLSLSQAYYALHRDEIGRRAAEESLEKLSRSIRSGAGRPRECLGQSAAGDVSDYAGMSRSQRDALKRRIYAAGALGEKIYPAACGR